MEKKNQKTKKGIILRKFLKNDKTQNKEKDNTTYISTGTSTGTS